MSTKLTKESTIKKTYGSEHLPPAFAEAASRRQVAPLCQRGVSFLPFVKGGEEGFALRCLYYRLINKFQGNLETQYVIS